MVNYSGHYYDYHYPNVYAGVRQFGGIGNPDEALGTLWYHDHKLDFTAQNVYAGLAGMNVIYDAWGAYADPNMGDYGDETKGWRLPCGANTSSTWGWCSMIASSTRKASTSSRRPASTA